MKSKIVVAEDEKVISKFLCTILSANGYEPLPARTGGEAYGLVTSHCPTALILDLGLPDMDGMELLAQIRSWSQLPILVVSARTHEREKVAALDAGADDYLTKPFGTAELLARLRTALRHVQTAAAQGTVQTGAFTVGQLRIDFDKRRVFLAGQDVHLTQNEYRIVAFLAQNAGKVLTHDIIMREVWGPAITGDNQILRVNMANIRRKLEKDPGDPRYLFTEVGVGYRMAEE